MRYLLLAYADAGRLGAMAEAERDALAGACREGVAELAASGRLLAAATLGPGCLVVRVRQGAMALSEGALAPAGELQLRAVLTISARDLNEAISVAAATPHARAGPIEVRPLLGEA